MVRISTSVLAIACTLATVSAAHAGSSWSFGFGIAGPPVYYGPPPVYYEPPVVYEPGPPVLYEEPVIVGPPVRAASARPTRFSTGSRTPATASSARWRSATRSTS